MTPIRKVCRPRLRSRRPARKREVGMSGAAMRRARVAAGMTQGDVAKAMGLQQAAVSFMESGRTIINPSRAAHFRQIVAKRAS